jgi:hypothetical protein
MSTEGEVGAVATRSVDEELGGLAAGLSLLQFVSARPANSKRMRTVNWDAVIAS